MAYAPQTGNPGTRGQDSRYDTTQTWWDPATGTYTDGYYHYPEQGYSVLSNDRPSTQVDGLFPADDERSRAGGGSSAGSSGGGSGLFASPYFQQYEAATRASGAEDLANTKAGLQDLFVSGGIIPEGFQDKLGFLTDAVRQLIQQNTKSGVSQYARLLEGKSDTLRATIARLASKGMGRSGAKGFRLNRNQLDFDRTLSDFLTALMGNAREFQSGYAGREAGRQTGLAQFLAQLAASYYTPFAPSGGGGVAQPQAAPSFNWSSYTPQQQMNTWQDFVQSEYTPGSPTNNPLWENPLPEGGYNHQGQYTGL